MCVFKNIIMACRGILLDDDHGYLFILNRMQHELMPGNENYF